MGLPLRAALPLHAVVSLVPLDSSLSVSSPLARSLQPAKPVSSLPEKSPAHGTTRVDASARVWFANAIAKLPLERGGSMMQWPYLVLADRTSPFSIAHHDGLNFPAQREQTDASKAQE
ncbi:hypothetical protein B0H11DRAFT_2245908 [Mycena galericulata]|nr:hypothetical protein B0H11DRAFT_2245908 [Mycena galericulata]